MKEFKPSGDFVSRVMRDVYMYENTMEVRLSLYEQVLASRPFRYALSGGGAFLGIFLTPAACI